LGWSGCDGGKNGCGEKESCEVDAFGHSVSFGGVESARCE
jgi:hypothetical protein